MAFKFVALTCLLSLALVNADLPDAPVRTPPLISKFGLGVIPLGGGRVVGGDDAYPGEFPHQVSLQWGSYPGAIQHFCGGTIIHKQWILTSGNCVHQVPHSGVFVVKAGKHDLSTIESTEQTLEVAKAFVHQQYLGNNSPFDIALLKLVAPLKLNYRVQTIKMPRPGVEPPSNVVLSGWGSISNSEWQVYPDKLQTVTLPIIDRRLCNASIDKLNHGQPSTLHETNICTGPLSGGLGACKGDAGGPLISYNQNGEKQLVGVVSWGFVPCGAIGAPTIYTKVSDFYGWIVSTMDLQ